VCAFGGRDRLAPRIIVPPWEDTAFHLPYDQTIFLRQTHACLATSYSIKFVIAIDYIKYSEVSSAYRKVIDNIMKTLMDPERSARLVE
jgi:hypothetical protein